MACVAPGAVFRRMVDTSTMVISQNLGSVDNDDEVLCAANPHTKGLIMILMMGVLSKSHARRKAMPLDKQPELLNKISKGRPLFIWGLGGRWEQRTVLTQVHLHNTCPFLFIYIYTYIYIYIYMYILNIWCSSPHPLPPPGRRSAPPSPLWSCGWIVGLGLV